MFFVVPESSQTPDVSKSSPPKTPSSYLGKRKHYAAGTDDVSSYYPKRVTKACDRCRLKKARCSGGTACEKCQKDGVICSSTMSKESKTGENAVTNPAYVRMVESQRDSLIQVLRRLAENSNLSSTEAANLPKQMDIAKFKEQSEEIGEKTLDQRDASQSRAESAEITSTNTKDSHLPVIENPYAGLPELQNLLAMTTHPVSRSDPQMNNTPSVDPNLLNNSTGNWMNAQADNQYELNLPAYALAVFQDTAGFPSGPREDIFDDFWISEDDITQSTDYT